jgi:predicted nucleic acid-binding OB-fold protein
MLHEFYNTTESISNKVHSLEIEIKKRELEYEASLLQFAERRSLFEIQLEIENLRRKHDFFRNALKRKIEE